MTLVHEGGAIVLRSDPDATRVLLVTAKREPRHWIFPKGHIEPGETAAAAALREAREEAGVVGRLLGPAGVIQYEFGGDTIRVEYFLVELEREESPGEPGRARAWLSYEKALERLSFSDTRELLRDAWRQLPRDSGA